MLKAEDMVTKRDQRRGCCELCGKSVTMHPQCHCCGVIIGDKGSGHIETDKLKKSKNSYGIDMLVCSWCYENYAVAT